MSMFNNVARGATIAFAGGLGLALSASGALAMGSVQWTNPAQHAVFQVGATPHFEGKADGFGVQGDGLDLALAIDKSTSVGFTLNQAIETAAEALVNDLPLLSTSVAVVDFASSVNTRIGLTPLFPPPGLANVLAAIDTSGSGVTATGPGIQEATAQVLSNNASSTAQDRVLVFSDGQSNTGISPVTAAGQAFAQGVIVDTVGLPGLNSSGITELQNVASAGGGTFIDATGGIQDLLDFFDGTGGGTLVGVDKVVITLPDGTDVDADLDVFGNFKLPVPPGWTIIEGEQTLTATAFFSDGTDISADLKVIGTTTPIPLPAAGWLLISGIGALAAMRRRAA